MVVVGEVSIWLLLLTGYLVGIPYWGLYFYAWDPQYVRRTREGYDIYLCVALGWPIVLVAFALLMIDEIMGNVR